MLAAFLAVVSASLAGLVCGGILFQRQRLQKDARRFPMPGRLVPTPAGSFHLHESGPLNGVTVILESGLAGSSLSWVRVQEQLADSVHVCSYDRTGFGWSGPIGSPRTLPTVVAELRQLLEQGHLSPPYILVGHSFGGLIVRAFAHRYPELTVGLVLVDPVSTEHWAACVPEERKRLQRGINFARRGATLARLGLVRLVLNLVIAGRRFIPQAVARVTAPGAIAFLQRITREIQKLPPPLWPIVQAQWSRPMGFRAISSYLEALQESCLFAESQLLANSVPTVILSAATATARELEERTRWLQASRDGWQVVLPDCGHWVQVEQPEAVVAAVRGALERIGLT